MLRDSIKDTNIATSLKYKNFKSSHYLYMEKGEISKGIQYIWIRCKNCSDILCVDGNKYLVGELFKSCFCYGKELPYMEETKDLFKYTNGFIKFSDEKVGMTKETDILISKGSKPSTVLVRCLNCNRIREVSEEEYFNGKTNNFKYCICTGIKRELKSGLKYGHLTILKIEQKTIFLECDCGAVKKTDWGYFNRNSIGLCSTNCTLNRITGKYTDSEYIGETFNNLKVLSILQRLTFYNQTMVKGTYWECLCLKCNRKTVFLASDVVAGIKTNCKCESGKYFLKYKPKEKIGNLLLNDIIIVPNKGTLWQCVCPFCGDYFIRDPNSFLTNHCLSCGCTSCSFGESVIWNFLNEYAKKYRDTLIYREKTYEGLYGTGNFLLRFDFCIKKENKQALIEFDGEQHKNYKKIKGVTDKDIALKMFEKIQKHDKLKDEFAKKNNIPLLRIDYTTNIVEIETKIKIFLKREGF